MDEREFQHATEVFGRLLESGEDASAFFQPTNEPFNDITLAVCVSIEFYEAFVAVFVLLRGDYGLDAQLQEAFVDPIGTIPLITTQRQRPRDAFPVAIEQASIRTIENLLQGSGFMGLAGRQMKMQRMTEAITEDMDFCGKTAARAA